MAAYASITSLLSRFVLSGLLLAGVGVAALGTDAAEARSGDQFSQQAAQAPIALTELPVQGRRTYEAILQGGPFRYDKDGTVFGNRERLLPPQRRGHYREYTVETPRTPHRGARRIVCGGERATAPSACWYTADHYASFRRIVP
jgi:ribonuclease T1